MILWFNDTVGFAEVLSKKNKIVVKPLLCFKELKKKKKTTVLKPSNIMLILFIRK